jgi:hypothetical protein
MHMITPAEVIRRIESYFDGGVLNYLTVPEAEAAAKGVAATQSNSFDSQPAPKPAQVSSLPRTILLQQATGAYQQMLSLSHDLHNAYATRHNLTFCSVRGSVQSRRPPVWDKIRLIQLMLATGVEFVVWLDADTLIMKPEIDVRSALRNGAPIAMCRNPIPWGDQSWHYNAGVILVRNTGAARWFFDEVWKAERVDHPWQEQARMNELSERNPNLVQTLDNKWNCTKGVNPTRDPIIRAWHGQGTGAIKLMRAALAAYKRKSAKSIVVSSDPECAVLK